MQATHGLVHMINYTDQTGLSHTVNMTFARISFTFLPGLSEERLVLIHSTQTRAPTQGLIRTKLNRLKVWISGACVRKHSARSIYRITDAPFAEVATRQ